MIFITEHPSILKQFLCQKMIPIRDVSINLDTEDPVRILSPCFSGLPHDPQEFDMILSHLLLPGLFWTIAAAAATRSLDDDMPSGEVAAIAIPVGLVAAVINRIILLGECTISNSRTYFMANHENSMRRALRAPFLPLTALSIILGVTLFGIEGLILFPVGLGAAYVQRWARQNSEAHPVLKYAVDQSMIRLWLIAIAAAQSDWSDDPEYDVIAALGLPSLLFLKDYLFSKEHHNGKFLGRLLTQDENTSPWHHGLNCATAGAILSKNPANQAIIAGIACVTASGSDILGNRNPSGGGLYKAAKTLPTAILYGITGGIVATTCGAALASVVVTSVVVGSLAFVLGWKTHQTR